MRERLTSADPGNGPDAPLRKLSLVAHRGYPLAFPENTLLGYRQAVAHGANFVETDVQCTRDGVPVLYHDDDTRRLSGVPGSVTGRSLRELQRLNAHYPGRFGGRFESTPISTLKTFCEWLADQPGLTAFIEIKRQSLKRFGIEPVVENVMRAIAPVTQRCVIISFNDECVAHIATRHEVRTGWVLRRWNRRAEARARELAPDYLFADRDMVPARPQSVWQGPWQWSVYVIDELAQALSFVERGFDLVETDAIGDMLDLYRAGYADKP